MALIKCGASTDQIHFQYSSLTLQLLELILNFKRNCSIFLVRLRYKFLYYSPERPQVRQYLMFHNSETFNLKGSLSSKNVDLAKLSLSPKRLMFVTRAITYLKKWQKFTFLFIYFHEGLCYKFLHHRSNATKIHSYHCYFLGKFRPKIKALNHQTHLSVFASPTYRSFFIFCLPAISPGGIRNLVRHLKL